MASVSVVGTPTEKTSVPGSPTGGGSSNVTIGGVPVNLFGDPIVGIGASINSTQNTEVTVAGVNIVVTGDGISVHTKGDDKFENGVVGESNSTVTIS